MSYVYRRDADEPLFTVGFYDPEGMWHTDTDHTDRESAAARVSFLNGGAHKELTDRLYDAVLMTLRDGSRGR